MRCWHHCFLPRDNISYQKYQEGRELPIADNSVFVNVFLKDIFLTLRVLLHRFYSTWSTSCSHSIHPKAWPDQGMEGAISGCLFPTDLKIFGLFFSKNLPTWADLVLYKYMIQLCKGWLLILAFFQGAWEWPSTSKPNVPRQLVVWMPSVLPNCERRDATGNCQNIIYW